MIHPTVGRVVWFRPNGAQHIKYMTEHDTSVPMDAHIVYVWGPRMVNLVIFDHNGLMYTRTSVDLVQEGDPIPPPGQAYCEWMPYQVGQAKKHEAEKAA
jgi:hypothetical protein